MTLLHHIVFAASASIAVQSVFAQQIAPSATPETDLAKEVREAERLGVWAAEGIPPMPIVEV